MLTITLWEASKSNTIDNPLSLDLSRKKRQGFDHFNLAISILGIMPDILESTTLNNGM